jgi:DNA-binding transcriptional LysR family regulator
MEGGIRVQLRQLEYVVAIVEWKTMRKAAQQLYVSEATISQQIRELEAELEIVLFEREGRTLKLASEGEKLLPFIQQVLHAKRELEEQVIKMKALAPGTLRFGVVPSIAWKFLPAILSSFQTLYPKIRLEVREEPSHEIIAQLRNHQIDVAVVAFSERVPFDLKGVVMKPLLRTELVALASRHHRLAFQEQVTKIQLAQEQLIVTREGFLARDLILAVLGAEIERNILYSTDNPLTSLKLAESGTGILFLPRFVMPGRSEKRWGGLRFLTLAPDVSFPLGYAYMYETQRARPQWFQAFLAVLQECCYMPDEMIEQTR